MANLDKKFPYLLLERRRHNEDLSVIRESYGEVNEQLLEVCRRMQKEFDPKDLEEVT
jgi:hypothetical protein